MSPRGRGRVEPNLVRHEWTHKFEQEGVFSQGADATGESEDEHHTADHQEEPDRVETAQVCDRGDVGQDTLGEQSEGLEA